MSRLSHAFIDIVPVVRQSKTNPTNAKGDEEVLAFSLFRVFAALATIPRTLLPPFSENWLLSDRKPAFDTKTRSNKNAKELQCFQVHLIRVFLTGRSNKLAPNTELFTALHAGDEFVARSLFRVFAALSTIPQTLLLPLFGELASLGPQACL